MRVPRSRSSRVRATALAGAVALAAGLLVAPTASAAGVHHWVDGAAASAGPGSGCGAAAAYTTVQAAVAAAGASDTVEVCPGTYTGNIAVPTAKAGLTLRGAKAGIPAGPEANPAGRGVDESILGADTAAAVLSLTATGVTVDGFTIRNSVGHAININNGAAVGDSIVNNVMEGTATTTVITAGIISSTFDGHRYANNNIRGFRYGMNVNGQLANAPGVIEGNYIAGWGTSGITMGSQHAAGHRISGNVLKGTRSIGITMPTTAIEISGNTITGPGSTGIYLASNPRSGAQVTGNTISGFTTGIWHDAPHASLPVGSPPNEVHLNNIAGNTSYGLRNAALPGAYDVSASCNWWGAASGPRTTESGAGDRVTVGNVSYNPWLIGPAPGADCVGGLLDPTAELEASATEGDAPLDVDFDGSASSDLDGTIVSYAWDFGDGSTGAGSTVSHTYLTPGTYVAALTVTDNHGRTGQAHVTITVNAPKAAPTANATAMPANGPAPLATTLDGSGSTDSDGTIVSYEWDFGDGTTGTGAVVGHVYTTPATYVAVLTVTDDDGLVGTAEVAIVVNEVPQPQVDNDCKKGGWEAYGFSNQGLCIRYVNTGKDARTGG